MKRSNLVILFFLVLVVSLPLAALGQTLNPGSVVRSTSSDTLYLVTPAGTLAAIPSPFVFDCLQLSGKKHYTLTQ